MDARTLRSAAWAAAVTVGIAAGCSEPRLESRDDVANHRGGTAMGASRPRIATPHERSATARDPSAPVAEPAAASAPPGVPVLVFHGVCDGPCPTDRLYDISRDELDAIFAGIAARGTRALAIADYVAWLHGEDDLDERRSVLLTFDDGIRNAWLLADPLLAAHGLRATMFVITQTADAAVAYHMSWAHIEEANRSGRWDLQLHAGRGHTRIATRDASGDAVTRPFYAWRAASSGGLEPLEAWKARAEGDLGVGVARLGAHLPGFEPLAFAVPYGDYGQKGTNDSAIPVFFREALEVRFGVWFTQSEPFDAAPSARGAGTRQAMRYPIGITTRAADVLAWFDRGGPP